MHTTDSQHLSASIILSSTIKISPLAYMKFLVKLFLALELIINWNYKNSAIFCVCFLWTYTRVI